MKMEGRKKVRILSIDGGRNSALMACKYLERLQTALRDHSGDPQAQVADFFDIAAGSGAAAAIAAAICGRAATPEQLPRVLRLHDRRRRRPTLWGRGPPSAPDEAVLTALFGDRTLSDLSPPLLVAAYDVTAGAPVVFSTASARHGGAAYNFRLRHLCCAAAAAVSAPAVLRALDGGGRTPWRCADAAAAAVMSNPSAAALTHVLNNPADFPGVRGPGDVLLLSLGGPAASGGDCVNVNVNAPAAWTVADVVDQAMSVAFAASPHNYSRVQAMRRLASWEEPAEVVMQIAEKTLDEKCSAYAPFSCKIRGSLTNSQLLHSLSAVLVAASQLAD